MPYTAHNFQPGHKLTALELNEMDNQIAESEAEIGENQEQIDQLPVTMRNSLAALSLEADEEHAYLYNGDTLLSTIPIPGALTGLVPCAGFTVDSPATVTALIGGTPVQLQSTRQPNDCNQPVLYISENPSVASVNSSGQITGAAVGNANVRAQCGNFSATVLVRVGRRVDLTDVPLYLTGRPMLFVDNHYLNVDAAGSARTYVTLFVDGGVTVPDGYTVNVTVPDTMRIMALAFVVPNEGGFTYAGDDPRPEAAGTVWLRVQNLTGTLDAKSIGKASGGSEVQTSGFAVGEDASFVNTLGAPCYVVLAVLMHDTPGDTTSSRASSGMLA